MLASLHAKQVRRYVRVLMLGLLASSVVFGCTTRERAYPEVVAPAPPIDLDMGAAKPPSVCGTTLGQLLRLVSTRPGMIGLGSTLVARGSGSAMSSSRRSHAHQYVCNAARARSLLNNRRALERGGLVFDASWLKDSRALEKEWGACLDESEVEGRL